MNKKHIPNPRPLNFVVPGEMYAALARFAAEDSRPVSSYVRHALEQHITKRLQDNAYARLMAARRGAS